MFALRRHERLVAPETLMTLLGVGARKVLLPSTANDRIQEVIFQLPASTHTLGKDSVCEGATFEP